VTNCPVGHVTTEIVKLYTTVCPVTEAEPTSTPVAQYTPINSYTVKPATSDISYTTLKSTTTQYRTVKLIKSTATVYAVPSSVSVKSEAPYPTGPATSGKVLGTASPSLSVVINKVTSSAEGVVSYTPTPKPTTFTGGASGVRGGMGMVVAVVMGGLFMIL
jgi:chitinase